MIRFLLIAVLFLGIGTGLKDGWLVLKWNHLLHSVGFTFLDPEDDSFEFSDFIFKVIEHNSNKEDVI